MGKAKVTIKDLAKNLNLSISTISLVLNDKQRPYVNITEETKTRVKDEARRLGYVSSRSASSLRSGKSKAIGYWHPLFNNDFSGVMVKNMQEAVKHAGYVMLSFPDMHNSVRGMFDMYIQWGVDGIIVFDGAEHQSEIDLMHSKYNIPVVGIGHWCPIGYDSVRVDFYQPYFDLCSHLSKIGCRRIAYVQQDYRSTPLKVVDIEADDRRYQGYCDAAKAFSFDPEFVFIEHGEGLKSSARTYIKEYIKNHGMPDALLCRNDDIAIGAYRGLCDMGIKVPEQVCITGCDGTEQTKYLEVPITTIDILSTGLDKRALELMLKRIKDPDAELTSLLLTPEISYRESTCRDSR
jgi:LacI family transcriptional regulator